MNITIKERSFPPHTPGVFLHVGKNGGSTLCSVMVHSCHSFIRKPCPGRDAFFNGTRIPTYFGALNSYIHVPDFIKHWGKNPSYTNFGFYTANMRDPFTRIQSVFTYTYHDIFRKCYKPCFPSLEDFATALGNFPQSHEPPYDSKNCTNFARGLAAGKVDCSSHFRYNTRTILTLIPGWNDEDDHALPPLFAIRTEHIARDFLTVNKVLGDPRRVTFAEAGGVNGRVQTKPAVSKNVSDAGMKRLCTALIPEYRVYFKFLSNAINLSVQDVLESMALSRQSCPDLVWLFDDLTRKLRLEEPTFR